MGFCPECGTNLGASTVCKKCSGGGGGGGKICYTCKKPIAGKVMIVGMGNRPLQIVFHAIQYLTTPT